MAFGKLLGKLFGGDAGSGLDEHELARRLDLPVEELKSFSPAYHEFRLPKRSGGTRLITAPTAELKTLQRRILRRVLGRLRAHPNATGFERGHSIVTNAVLHAGKAVVIRLDIRDFFPTTSARRVSQYFRDIGWNRAAAAILTKLTTHEGCLPQGAPTSPRLANLVNKKLDTRLARLANSLGAAYTRYADDLTFSFAQDEPKLVKRLKHAAGVVLDEYGYALNAKKTRVLRAHQQQRVTGLVVNRGVRLPRVMRRRLRAIEHKLHNGGGATLSAAQFAGWQAYMHMIEMQSAATGEQ